jgi:2-polyprenyl-3-methyl-5-hydroxy-6-metoxy-1,4-benzoquinol methylase
VPGIKKHWETIFHTKGDMEMDWFQAIPKKSIQLIEQYSETKQHTIIDIGAGNSNLTKTLCSRGYKHFSVLDISEVAIERCRAKLQKCKGIHELIATDILDFNPSSAFHIWHDRAAFHFLTQAKDIKKYVSIASKNITKSGYLILATFALTGPTTCSNLPVTRYNALMLEKLFSHSFKLIESLEEKYITPSGVEQDFIWVVLQRN